MTSSLQGNVVRQGRERLHESPYHALRQISCEFAAGVLTLRGSVTSFFHKQVAQQLVLGLAEVQRVDNQIEVSPPHRVRPTTHR